MKDDLLRGAKGFVITFVLLWLLGGFIAAEFNPMQWSILARAVIIVASLFWGFIALIADDQSEDKNVSEELKTPVKPYIPATRPVEQSIEQKVDNKLKPFVPGTRIRQGEKPLDWVMEATGNKSLDDEG